MASLDEVPATELLVKELMDFLVDPLLPLKVSSEEPLLSTQESVAKQMHAVVLLHNYYHRKQHPEVKPLDFESFCKLAIALKPALKAHMKLDHPTDLTRSDEQENQFSLTEKAIKDACNISTALDASKDVPSTEGWPVAKVSVLLVDSEKENCWLLFGSVTSGVWSFIEKHLDIPNESPLKEKQANKRRRTEKLKVSDEQSNEEMAFQQVAFSAVKEATGMTESELVVLKRHIVYSLSKQNTVAYFYIMQCTQSGKGDFQHPIKETIESLQGPLLRKISGGWTLTPKYEYYDVLPCSQIISDWISRDVSSNSSGTSNVSNSQRTGNNFEKEIAQSNRVTSNVLNNFTDDLGNVNANSSQMQENPSDGKVHENKDSNKANGKDLSIVGPERSKKISVDKLHTTSNSSGKRNKMVDGLAVTCPLHGDKNRKSNVPMKVYRPRKTKISVKSGAGSSADGGNVKVETVETIMSNSTKVLEGKIAENRSHGFVSFTQNGTPVAYSTVVSDEMTVEDSTVVPSEPIASHVEKLQTTLAAKDVAITQATLRILFNKRAKLSHQQRNIVDEIALCDRDIQQVLDGNEDALALKIEAIIDCCNDMCLKGRSQIQEKRHQHGEGEGKIRCMKAKKLSDAILTLQSPCQDLDDICCMNNWALPVYSVSASDGGFLANITMKEMDFSCSSASALLPTPESARESAAALMIAKLREMAGQT